MSSSLVFLVPTSSLFFKARACIRLGEQSGAPRRPHALPPLGAAGGVPRLHAPGRGLRGGLLGGLPQHRPRQLFALLPLPLVSCLRIVRREVQLRFLSHWALLFVLLVVYCTASRGLYSMLFKFTLNSVRCIQLNFAFLSRVWPWGPTDTALEHCCF